MLPSLIENSIISNFNKPGMIFAPENDKEIYHYCVKNEINAVFEKCKYPDSVQPYFKRVSEYCRKMWQ